jgi:hypothetical protein
MFRLAALILLILPACSSGSVPASATDALPLTDAGLPVVPVRCDVASQTCPAGQRCDFTCENGVLVIACTAEVANSAQLGQACSGGRDAGTLTGSNCTRGTGCFGSSGMGAVCFRYCKTGSECPAGTKCDTTTTYRAVCPRSGGDLPIGLCR